MAYLTTDFFERDVVTVARELVGCVLEVRADGGTVCSGRIAETEAYGGEDDPASHAGRGRTPRSAIMFGPPAVAYVYLVYGMHHCLNFVTGLEGEPGAVLIRACEPLAGRAIMATRRGLDPTACRDGEIAAGPGRLCQAMGIDLGWNGKSLVLGPAFRIRASEITTPIEATPRVGIRKAVKRRHRFVDPVSNCLSI